MIDLVFLTEDFFCDYADCPEIERKIDRPHAQMLVEVYGQIFCVPFRSSINHPHAIWTDKKRHRGMDLSKAVVILNPDKYIDRARTPYLRENEYEVFKNLNEYTVKKKLLKYIEEYKKAKNQQSVSRNRTLVTCSTLQYFEEYI